jgi:hypothetical protein
VLTGGGGGSTSPVCEPVELCGRVEVRAAGGTLSGTTDVAMDALSPTTFSFTAPLTGTGRFRTGFISVDVNGDTALINEIVYESANGAFGETAKIAPALVTVTPDGCTDGRTRVETTITTTIQNFGPTTIRERHCYLLPTV